MMPEKDAETQSVLNASARCFALGVRLNGTRYAFGLEEGGRMCRNSTGVYNLLPAGGDWESLAAPGGGCRAPVDWR
jgi:hypothetical protein